VCQTICCGEVSPSELNADSDVIFVVNKWQIVMTASAQSSLSFLFSLVAEAQPIIYFYAFVCKVLPEVNT